MMLPAVAQSTVELVPSQPPGTEKQASVASSAGRRAKIGEPHRCGGFPLLGRNFMGRERLASWIYSSLHQKQRTPFLMAQLSRHRVNISRRSLSEPIVTAFGCRGVLVIALAMGTGGCTAVHHNHSPRASCATVATATHRLSHHSLARAAPRRPRRPRRL